MPYAHPEALVGAEWLAAHLDDPHVRVLDVSYKQPGITPTAREDYQRGHIPGAVSSGRPSAFHFSRPPSSSATLSWP